MVQTVLKSRIVNRQQNKSDGIKTKLKKTKNKQTPTHKNMDKRKAYQKQRYHSQAIKHEAIVRDAEQHSVAVLSSLNTNFISHSDELDSYCCATIAELFNLFWLIMPSSGFFDPFHGSSQPRELICLLTFTQVIKWTRASGSHCIFCPC